MSTGIEGATNGVPIQGINLSQILAVRRRERLIDESVRKVRNTWTHRQAFDAAMTTSLAPRTQELILCLIRWEFRQLSSQRCAQ